MKRILEYVRRLQIKKKLLVIYALTGILPVVCLGMFLIGHTRSLVLQQHQSQAESENKRVRIILFDVTYLASNISQILFYDNDLKKIVSERYPADPAAVYEAYRRYTLIDSHKRNYTEISDITIYVNNSTMLPYGHFRLITDEVRQTDWYRTAANSKGEIIWTVDPSMGQDGHLFLVRKIPVDRASGFLILRIGISNNFLKLMVRDSELLSIAALQNGEVFFSDKETEIGAPLPIVMERSNPRVMRTDWAAYQGNRSLASLSTLTPVNASNAIDIATIDADAWGNMNGVALSISAIVAISLLVPLVIILLFSGSFSRRIGILRSEMHKVAEGNFNVTDHFNGQDELSDVYADMKTMIGCIQTLYREIYNEKLTKEMLANRQRTMELELLMSQINPHFLFNTLETIRMQAVVEGSREVARITKMLGKSIRRLLEVGSAPVTMASELEYIRIYMNIQIFRFNKISFSIDVAADVDINSYRILPLLLQPVVENAIVHGLEVKGKSGRLDIRIYRQHGFLLIVVSDDGAGMSEEQSAVLRAMLEAGETAQVKRSIGLLNVHQRIRLFYGEAYGVEIISKTQEGTTVTLRLPA